MFRKILQVKLKFFAKKILQKYNPQIIGITGSVGKTSAKEAIAAVLGTRFNIRQNIKNYNNEIGLPLTIIGAESAGRSVSGWMKIFSQASNLLKSIAQKNGLYPQILILEMGVDRPGDIRYMCDIAKPKIGVITNISHSHFEFFGSQKAIQQEKGELLNCLEDGGVGVLNYDNKPTRELFKKNPKIKYLTYGIEEGADVRAIETQISYEKDGRPRGMSFKLVFQGSAVPVFVEGRLGLPIIYACLAGAAVGFAYDFNPVDISEALRQAKWPNARMQALSGVNNSVVINDTYNSSPESCLAALDIFAKIKKDKKVKKWAVLGDMLELGAMSQEGHEKIGLAIAKLQIDMLAIVGVKARDIARSAHKKGFPKERILAFADSMHAGEALKKQVGENDLILVKGSRGMEMEKAVQKLNEL